MKIQRITNSLSKKPGHYPKKRNQIFLCTLCLTAVIVVVMLLGTFLFLSNDDVDKGGNQLNKHQKRQAQIRGVVGVGQERQIEANASDDNDIKLVTDYPESQDTNDESEDFDVEDTNTETIITLSTTEGDIHIKLLPKLSLSSVQYIKTLVKSSIPCEKCRFYRAEKPGILQGILAKKSILPNKVLGGCPDKYSDIEVEKSKCPEWDSNCDCHGPIMTRGMVGWAGGGGGPDFFIDMYKKPALHWENQHTVWGEVLDKNSLAVIDGIFELDVNMSGSMSMLKKELHISLNNYK